MQKYKSILIATLGWGSVLWLVGYLLGMILFFVIPTELIGWIITPVGIALTMWVLIRKIHQQHFYEYLVIGIVWAALAVMLDYVFLVKMLNNATYYKLDVYFYYATTLLLPLLIGRWKLRKRE